MLKESIHKCVIEQRSPAFNFALHHAEPLKFAYKDGALTVWYLAGPDFKNRYYRVLPTGAKVLEGYVYRETYFTDAGDVYHIFETT